jgi:hypothetical protein
VTDDVHHEGHEIHEDAKYTKSATTKLTKRKNPRKTRKTRKRRLTAEDAENALTLRDLRDRLVVFVVNRDRLRELCVLCGKTWTEMQRDGGKWRRSGDQDCSVTV